MARVTRQRCPASVGQISTPESCNQLFEHRNSDISAFTANRNTEITDDVITRGSRDTRGACNLAIAIVFNDFNQRWIYSTFALNYARCARAIREHSLNPVMPKSKLHLHHKLSRSAGETPQIALRSISREREDSSSRFVLILRKDQKRIEIFITGKLQSSTFHFESWESSCLFGKIV